MRLGTVCLTFINATLKTELFPSSAHETIYGKKHTSKRSPIVATGRSDGTKKAKFKTKK